ncbi:4'-phosphopantetheinyl transferase family protein [Pantoea sp. FN060301]|uniref:4'-phosphopantetheinyl transferase family protein n=1 Tax=Pantoea sp. FN060301 TaxID=3420380 RepID=UPI003D181C2F
MDITERSSLPTSGSPDPLFPTVPAHHFLSGLFACALPGHPDVLLYCASYNAMHYSEALFDDMAIPRPQHLGQAVRKRRAEYLASRAVVRCALQRWGADDYILGNGPQREPLWPEGIRGSLSHTHQRISLLLTRTDSGKQPGVDCERLLLPGKAEALQERIIHPAERKILQHSGLSFATGLTAAFSVKESLYKALYPQLGQFMSFREATIVHSSPGAEQMIVRLTRHFSSAFEAGREFSGGVRHSESELLSWVVVNLCRDGPTSCQTLSA